MQVFRFTLGIPGFDDANIPRVVGLVGALGMTVNHALGGTPSSAQACRLFDALAALCVATRALVTAHTVALHCQCLEKPLTAVALHSPVCMQPSYSMRLACR